MRADQRTATNGAVPADSEAATATVRVQTSSCFAFLFSHRVVSQVRHPSVLGCVYP